MLNLKLAKRALLASAAAIVIVLPAGPAASDDDELPFAVTTLIIELTDNDIELQAFADAGEWKRLKISDPNERAIFNARAVGRLKRQDGMSEMFWASEPSHFLPDDPDFDEPLEAFLRRFPEGQYEFEGVTASGLELEGEATLTHVLPALPEILAPVSDTEDPPVVDPNNLVIDWEPVTTRFIGDGPVEIFEYQVIVEQVEPEREVPWVDGTTRRTLINVPPEVTAVTVPPEFLLPGASYDFEVLAIEISGNSTISVGEFVTE